MLGVVKGRREGAARSREWKTVSGRRVRDGRREERGLEGVGLGCQQMGEDVLKEAMERGGGQQTVGRRARRQTATEPRGWDTVEDDTPSLDPQRVARGFQWRS